MTDTLKPSDDDYKEMGEEPRQFPTEEEAKAAEEEQPAETETEAEAQEEAKEPEGAEEAEAEAAGTEEEKADDKAGQKKDEKSPDPFAKFREKEASDDGEGGQKKDSGVNKRIRELAARAKKAEQELAETKASQAPDPQAEAIAAWNKAHPDDPITPAGAAPDPSAFSSKEAYLQAVQAHGKSQNTTTPQQGGGELPQWFDTLQKRMDGEVEAAGLNEAERGNIETAISTMRFEPAILEALSDEGVSQHPMRTLLHLSESTQDRLAVVKAAQGGSVAGIVRAVLDVEQRMGTTPPTGEKVSATNKGMPKTRGAGRGQTIAQAAKDGDVDAYVKATDARQKKGGYTKREQDALYGPG